MKFYLLILPYFFIIFSLNGQTMNTASSTSGIAPFAVFFDATEASSGVVQPQLVNGRREYADLYYLWDFGDANSGVWPYSERLKNQDIGYNACHVYNEPGDYTVTLTVRDLAGGIYTYTQDIEVLNQDESFPGNNTICVSSSGNFDGAPSGALHLTTTDIIDIAPYIATGNRILLRRGDSWTTSDYIPVHGIPGPFVLGAYGNGVGEDEYGIYSNAPLITLTGLAGDTSFIEYWDVNNWIIVDLHFVGDTTYNAAIGGGVGECTNMLHYRLECEGFSTPVGTTHWDTDGNDRWMLISCKIHDTGGITVYTGSERVVVMGNLICNSIRTHALRVWQAYKGVISHNYCHGSSLLSSSGRHALKFHGPDEETIARTDELHLEHRTQYSVVYDNIFGTCGPWQVPISPEDDSSDERLSDILVEGNRFIAGYGTPSLYSLPVFLSLRIQADYVTIRNNVFDGTGSGDYWGAVHVLSTDFKNSVGNRIFNNTVMKQDYPVGDPPYITFEGFTVDDSVENTVIQNNLVYLTADNLDVEELIVDNGINTVADHNLLTRDSCFVDPDNPDLSQHDFHLLEGCVAVDSGTNVSILHDFDLMPRPSGGAIDLGAFEYIEGSFVNPDRNIFNEENGIKIYPNPFEREATIEIALEETAKDIKAEIFDITGRLVERGIYLDLGSPGLNKYKLKTDGLESGVYFLKLNVDSRVCILKFEVLR
jgi:hypothetical protein